MLIDRADGAINICEMKYAKDEFVIDAIVLNMSKAAIAMPSRRVILVKVEL